VCGALEGAEVRIAVDNPLPPATGNGHRGSGVALDNIGHRLRALYGDDAAVVTRVVAGRFRAELRYRPAQQSD
jgi:two-component system sensor histidine kinase AlgZ